MKLMCNLKQLVGIDMQNNKDITYSDRLVEAPNLTNSWNIPVVNLVLEIKLTDP